MNNLKIALEYISLNSLIGLKAGNDRQTFLDIWMVIVDNKIFARSWGFAEKSWYNTFLQDNFGQIKCGDKILNITAKPITHDIELTEKINKAYLDKYNHEESAFYAQGIIKPEHIAKTMEFQILE